MRTPWDLKIAANGKALFDAQFEGSGSVPFRQIDLSTDTIAVRADNHGQVRQNTLIHRGADRSLLFVTESNASNGPVFTYSAAGDNFPKQQDSNVFLGNALSAVNRN